MAKAFFTLNHINDYYSLTKEAVEDVICSLFSLYQASKIEEFALKQVESASNAESILDECFNDEILYGGDSEDEENNSQPINPNIKPTGKRFSLTRI